MFVVISTVAGDVSYNWIMTKTTLVAACKYLAIPGPVQQFVSNCVMMWRHECHKDTRHRMFAARMAVHMNARRACIECGYSVGAAGTTSRRLMEDPKIREYIVEALAENAKQSELDAQYVRDYIKSVLDFCPMDFFAPCPGGGWLISEENYKNLPQKFRCLIEDIELRVERGVSMLAIKFLSKTAALAMAARYTLTEKHQLIPAKTVDWKELASAENDAVDAVEEKIKLMEHAA